LQPPILRNRTETRTPGRIMSASPPSLDQALKRVRDAYARMVAETPDDALRETLDDLLARLDDLAGEDGSIPLDDGSRLFLTPERGDRGGETHRLGAVQRFRDGRPPRIHLVTP
jgi:hypothetical protein